MQVIQNLLSFQTWLKFLKSIHSLWRYNIWHKRRFSTLLKSQNDIKLWSIIL